MPVKDYWELSLFFSNYLLPGYFPLPHAAAAMMYYDHIQNHQIHEPKKNPFSLDWLSQAFYHSSGKLSGMLSKQNSSPWHISIQWASFRPYRTTRWLIWFVHLVKLVFSAVVSTWWSPWDGRPGGTSWGTVEEIGVVLVRFLVLATVLWRKNKCGLTQHFWLLSGKVLSSSNRLPAWWCRQSQNLHQDDCSVLLNLANYELNELLLCTKSHNFWYFVIIKYRQMLVCPNPTWHMTQRKALSPFPWCIETHEIITAYFFSFLFWLSHSQIPGLWQILGDLVKR